MQHNAVEFNIVLKCNTVQYKTVECHAMLFNATQHATLDLYVIQCNAILYNLMQFDEMAYNVESPKAS